ncbi:MAG: single-stranded DNA-binding protein [Bacteroidetes bacterium]|nr:single-stranded DNA-binding protein [Bacteroidota bacterium]
MKNKVTLIGHVGNSPELKTFEGDKKLVRLSLATNESYKNKKGEKVTDTTWHNVIAWGALAERICKYAQKGSEIAVEGKLINNNYVDKEGVKRYSTEIQLSDMLLLGSKQ